MTNQRSAQIESARIIGIRHVIADAASVERAIACLLPEQQAEIRQLSDAARQSQLALLQTNFREYKKHKPAGASACHCQCEPDSPPCWLSAKASTDWHDAITDELTRYQHDFVSLFQACMRAGINIPQVPAADAPEF